MEFQEKQTQYILKHQINMLNIPTEKAKGFYSQQMDIFFEEYQKLNQNVDNHMDIFLDGTRKLEAYSQIKEISTVNKILIEINQKLENKTKGNDDQINIDDNQLLNFK